MQTRAKYSASGQHARWPLRPSSKADGAHKVTKTPHRIQKEQERAAAHRAMLKAAQAESCELVCAGEHIMQDLARRECLL